MKIKDAVAQRIIDLCKEKNIAINALGNISGVNPSTIYSILNTKSQNPGVVTLQKICDGLEISIRDFFDVELFDDIEQEIIKANSLRLPAVRYVSLFISSGIGAVNSIIFSVTGCVKRTKQQCSA